MTSLRGWNTLSGKWSEAKEIKDGFYPFLGNKCYSNTLVKWILHTVTLNIIIMHPHANAALHHFIASSWGKELKFSSKRFNNLKTWEGRGSLFEVSWPQRLQTMMLCSSVYPQVVEEVQRGAQSPARLHVVHFLGQLGGRIRIQEHQIQYVFFFLYENTIKKVSNI